MEQIKLLERAATDYNRIQYLIDKGSQYPFVTNLATRTGSFETALVTDLVAYLKQWVQRYTNYVDTNPITLETETKVITLFMKPLEQCLRAFAAIDQVDRAELLLRANFVEPSISKVG